MVVYHIFIISSSRKAIVERVGNVPGELCKDMRSFTHSVSIAKTTYDSGTVVGRVVILHQQTPYDRHSNKLQQMEASQIPLL